MSDDSGLVRRPPRRPLGAVVGATVGAAGEQLAPIPLPLAPLDRNPAVVYLGRLGKGSRPTMAQSLRTAIGVLSPSAPLESFGWASLRYQHVAVLRQALLDGGAAPRTVNKVLSAVRGVMHEAWRLGLIAGEDYQRVKDVEGVKVDTLPAGREIADAEIDALFAACDLTKSAGARDAALLSALCGAGLRRAEIVSLRLEDFDKSTGELRVLGGKRRKDRTAYLSREACAYMTTWLEHRGEEAGPLLCRVTKGGLVVLDRHLTPKAVWWILSKIVERAAARAASPHDFRRTFISSLLNKNVDIVTISKLVGHADVSTTARYDRRGEEPKRRAVEKLHIPKAR